MPSSAIMPFEEKLRETACGPLRAEMPVILQLNVGRRCNLQCTHCHVDAGPVRTEMMPRAVFEQCLAAVKRTPEITTVDITGGAPEMNPHLAWFIGEVSALVKRLIIRSNLAILEDEAYHSFIALYAKHRVEICASLPCYGKEFTDRQRGAGVYEKCIRVIRQLNARGYGMAGSGLTLNLVHNPPDVSLPGDQIALEAAYRTHLQDEQNVVFNNLFCIANAPVGRFLRALADSGSLAAYQAELVGVYNPAAVDQVMCKTTLSVGYDGTLYDCDFNQMQNLPIDAAGFTTIAAYDPDALAGRRIVTGDHCYSCTAGPGSSCQGATA